VRRPELVAELERLGRAPAPPPDEAKVARWQHQLLHELPRLELLDVAAADRPRGHRRPAVLGALVLAAAASVTALVVHHSGGHVAELQEVSGAVVVLPDGSRKPLHAGDQLPPGGIVETGPDGRLTVGGVTVGPNQLSLVEDGGVTPLPGGTTSPTATTAAPTTVTAPPASSTAPPRPATPATTATRPVTAPQTSAVPSGRPVANATTPPPVPAAPPATHPTTAPNPASPSPAAVAPVSRLLALSVAPSGDGVRLAWSQTQPPRGSSAFGRYVVIRAVLSLSLPKVIGVLPSQATTWFTDAAAPRGVRLYYRVLAIDAANHLLAVSPAVPIELPAPAPATSAPPSTMTAQSTVPPRRPGGGSHPAPSTSAPGPSAPAPSAPSTSTLGSSTPATTAAPGRHDDRAAGRRH
jgi:hypothetical protein